jgi:hypothetical protein
MVTRYGEARRSSDGVTQVEEGGRQFQPLRTMPPGAYRVLVLLICSCLTQHVASCGHNHHRHLLQTNDAGDAPRVPNAGRKLFRGCDTREP